MKYNHMEISYGIVIYMDDENMELEEEGEIVGDESSGLVLFLAQTSQILNIHQVHHL